MLARLHACITFSYLFLYFTFSKKFQQTIDLSEFAKGNILKKSLLLKSLKTYKALMCKCCLVAYEKDTIHLDYKSPLGLWWILITK